MAAKGLWNRADLRGAPMSGDGKVSEGSLFAGRESAPWDPAPDDDGGGIPFTGEDLDRFMEMLERSNPRAFRELLEEDPGWA